MFKFLVIIGLLSAGLWNSAAAAQTAPNKQTNKIEAINQKIDFKRKISSENFNIPCEAEVLNTLSELEIPLEWILVRDSEDLRILKSKTPDKEIELEMSFDQNRTIVRRYSKDEIVSYSFVKGSQCASSVSISKNDRVVTKTLSVFSDYDTNEWLKQCQASKDKIFILYIWSPRMNLSIKGVDEIRRISQQEQYHLTVIADSLANDDQVRMRVLENRWPADFSRKMESTKLDDLGIRIHFPATLVCSAGKLNAVRPGYDEPARLLKYLRQLSQGTK